MLLPKLKIKGLNGKNCQNPANKSANNSKKQQSITKTTHRASEQISSRGTNPASIG
jgi:hypothetical protein